MQFTPTPEQQALYDAAFRYAEARLHPLFARMDDEDWFPDQLIAQLGADGYCGLTAPQDLGGAGMDLMSAGMVAEAFGYWNTNAAFIWGPHENLCLNNILRNGTPEQIARFVPDLIAGRKIGALGLTEPGAGSDALGSMALKAVRDGDDYVLTGRKMFISNGPVADLVLTYAKTAPERGAKGISAFVVDTRTQGFSVAQTLTKMGWRGCPTGELVFEGVRVPAANLLGAENAGVGVVMSGLDIERAFLGLPYIGAAQRCLDLSLDYAATRRQFGKPIGSFQMIQAHLAEMATLIDAARLYAYRALSACDGLARGEGGRGEIHRLCAGSVLFGADMIAQVTDRAVQIHGGSGFVWETEVNRHYRNARIASLGGGTTEVRKLIIAEELFRARGLRLD
ncbi:acyl-CoA dehydrogenase family protein [Pararhodobacter zhoushanensis]|uniref:Acyl-CoA dehydrogenase family protein n=1 Tax=Pararhodobacter zhoushanensis TaxID=2479545 RepID=A0ABT3H229_9RHOB|nr:acyl-CoA dehydrogenase family protein [Pararhodobacter zhoushanensis]MCW1933813.1 acyl-CoA dehydrogenase family protein [Pararhodobacter zhoushanensis]